MPYLNPDATWFTEAKDCVLVLLDAEGLLLLGEQEHGEDGSRSGLFFLAEMARGHPTVPWNFSGS